MAAERDFELLDDYLADRMAEGDRSTFEEKLTADADLQQEYVIQKDLIEGIKRARVAELKAMLNKVPVPSGNAGNALGLKVALGTAAAVLIVAAAYWLTREQANEALTPKQSIHIEEPAPVEQPAEPALKSQDFDAAKPPISASPQEEVPQQERAPVDSDKNQTSAGTEHSKPSLAKRPGALSAPAVPDNPASAAGIEVKADDSRYSFHYQYHDGKVLLYGPFQKDSCDLVDIVTEGKRLTFLSYGDQFYPLQKGDEEIKPLVSVKDTEILKKLSNNQQR